MEDLLVIIALFGIFAYYNRFGFMAMLLKPIDEIRKSLGSSVGLGKGGERTLRTILDPYISTNLCRKTENAGQS